MRRDFRDYDPGDVDQQVDEEPQDLTCPECGAEMGEIGKKTRAIVCFTPNCGTGCEGEEYEQALAEEEGLADEDESATLEEQLAAALADGDAESNKQKLHPLTDKVIDVACAAMVASCQNEARAVSLCVSAAWVILSTARKVGPHEATKFLIDSLATSLKNMDAEAAKGGGR